MRNKKSKKLIQAQALFPGLIPHSLLFFICLLFNSSAIADTQTYSLDFIYVNSNIGEAAGGHTALRFGDSVFHYQFYPDGKFLLERESWQHFLLVYHELRNRSLFIASLALQNSDYNQLKNHFTHLLMKQQQSLESQKKIQQSLFFVNELRANNKRLSIPGLGFFDRFRIQKKNKKSTDLQRAIKQNLGSSFLKTQTKYVHDALYKTALTLHHSNDLVKFQKQLTLYSVLNILQQSTPLQESMIIPPLRDEKPLTQIEKEALSNHLLQMETSIISLLQSSRSDRGSALLLQVARYEITRYSIEKGYFLTLDPFSDSAISVSVTDESNKTLEKIRRQFLQEARAQKNIFIKEKDYPEIAWSLLESSRGRLYELEQGIHNKQSVRVGFGILVPSRRGELSLAEFNFKQHDLKLISAQLDSNYQKISDYTDKNYAYNLIERNCATELIRSLNSAFQSRAEAEEVLGGSLNEKSGLAFIPFLFYKNVRTSYNITHEEIILSRRLQKLEKMYEDEDAFTVWLRESNTLSSTLYDVREEDTPFLFFTDDALLLRPVLGILNFSYAAVYGGMAIFTLPADGGDGLYQAGRGMFYSLPELAFGNIRKGTYGYAKVSSSTASP